MGDEGGIMIGQAHPWAKQWNADVQDPFSARVQAIFDPVTEARKAGTLTYDQASTALEQFNAEVENLTQAQKQFEVLGGGQKQVIAQSRQTLDPMIAQWRADLQAHLDAMPKPDVPPDLQPKDAPSLDTILGGTTPSEMAGRAATRQRRQALGGGRQSTILAGLMAPRPTGAAPKLRGY